MTYYVSALTIRHQENPYITISPLAAKLGLDLGGVRRSTDPPTFILAFQPFTLLPEREAFWVWSGLNAACLLAAVTLLTVGFGWRARLAIAALALMYPPVNLHFQAGQSKMVLLLLLVLATRSMKSGWDRTAGVCIGAATLLRVFPAILLIYLTIQRRWEVLICTTITIGVGALVTVWALGLQTCLSFGAAVRLFNEHTWTRSWGNTAILAQFAGIRSATIRRAYVAVTWALVLGATLFATMRLSERSDPYWFTFGLWIIAAILLSPIGWPFDMVLAAIPLIQITAASRDRVISEVVQWMGIASYGAMVFAPLAPKLMPFSMGVEAWFGATLLTFITALTSTLRRCEWLRPPGKATIRLTTGSSIKRCPKV
jgi:hypothetical protein